MWTLVPAMVVWSAVVVRDGRARGEGCWVPGAVIGAVWVYLARARPHR